MAIREDPVESWLSTPFPRGSTDDALGELRADLAVVDTIVAGSILRYRNAGEWVLPVPDVVGELSRLRKSITATQSADSRASELVASYLEYVELLTEAYGAFLAARP